MKKTRIIAFSGFLGNPTDWDFWRPYLPEQYSLEAFVPDLREGETCPDWCLRFLREDQNQTPSLLVGYSLGGRAASQLVVRAPSRFKGLLAISTHPGLQTQKERDDRIYSDQIWAARFALESGENWDQILHDWNSQSVFQAGLNFGLAPPVRHESIGLRLRSKRQLLQMGLGTQSNLRGPLIESEVPQIWANGALDLKFSALASDFSRLFCNDSRIPKTQLRWHSVANAGHRFPWQLPPEHSAKLLNQWIGELDEKARQ